MKKLGRQTETPIITAVQDDKMAHESVKWFDYSLIQLCEYII